MLPSIPHAAVFPILVKSFPSLTFTGFQANQGTGTNRDIPPVLSWPKNRVAHQRRVLLFPRDAALPSHL